MLLVLHAFRIRKNVKFVLMITTLNYQVIVFLKPIVIIWLDIFQILVTPMLNNVQNVIKINVKHA